MLIDTHDLTLQIGTAVLVRALNWQVGAGECWCVIGRNGAGKTTLLRHLAGLSVPVSGLIRFDGQPTASINLSELARLRSFLPQGRNDPFAYRVIDTVLAARHPYHDGQYWESATDQASAMAALRALDVADLAGRDVRSLSGGERQRVAIAAQLAQDARCMLLDEPTTALDLSHQISVMQLLAQRCADGARAVVMASHDLNLVVRHATHALLLMPDGSWLAGPAQDVMQREPLGRCLACPIHVVRQDGYQLFVPEQT